MKKIYLPLLAFAACIFTSVGAFAQQTITFNGNSSSNWNNAANWSTGTVPNNLTNVILVVPSGISAVVTGTYTYNNTQIRVYGSLQMGNGSGNGSAKGVINLDAQSSVAVASGAKITSKDVGNTNNQITIDGVIKFQGGNPEVDGPALANSTSTGFQAASLPVVLVGFNANLASDNKVNIQWTTQQEISTDHFEIQRSSDGLSWQTIATVKASGYSALQKSYSIEDAAPQGGTNLYRLRMVDLDAKFGFSSVVNVRLSLLGKVSIFPNPTVNNVNISLGHAPAANWTLSLVNQIGQVVVRKTFGKETTTVSLPVSHFPTGNYSVEITDGVSSQSSKLMIAHQ